MKVVMLGAPGAGKGTQAKKIAVEYRVLHISTGDIFRANIKGGTKLGVKAKVFMDAGGLVPGEITIGILLGRIHEADCQNGYVLDGFSRTIPQVESLTEALGEMGESINYTVSVDTPDENVTKRISGRYACLVCGATYHTESNPPEKEGICNVCSQVLVLRDDNRPETVKKHLDVCHDQTQPPIEYHQKADVLAQADGTMDMEDVFQAIVKILGA